MANEEHEALLKQGVESWNQWREENPELVPDLSQASLSRANLNEANLSGVNLQNSDLRMANLSDADLQGADLSSADLRGANLRGVNLNLANLTGTDLNGAYLTLVNFIDANLTAVNLSEANLRIANLSRANLSEANLRMANLSGANLSEANLQVANLNDANLRMANLSDANLEKTQVLSANFNKAILTGTCLQDWQINSATNLSEVICEYIYLQTGQQKRHPDQGNFAPGEFAQLWHQHLNRVQVKVSPDVPPVPASVAQPTTTSVASVPEVKVEIQQPQTPPVNYTATAGVPEVKVDIQPPVYEAVTPSVAKEVDQSPSSPFLSDSPTLPPNLQQAVSEVHRILEQLDQNLSQPKWSEVAAEIQQLLQELSQTCPTRTPLEKVIAVAAAIKQIESNPGLKARVVEAVQTAQLNQLQEYINHPLSKILLPAIAEWN